jgi:hypothetical protein
MRLRKYIIITLNIFAGIAIGIESSLLLPCSLHGTATGIQKGVLMGCMLMVILLAIFYLIVISRRK